MRTPLLFLAVATVVVAACAGSTSTGARTAPPAPGHHQPTAAPWTDPAATPYDGVTFQDPGINPCLDPDEDRVSTFALDVDTASYTIAQRYVDDGFRPDPASVRVEEWINAFDQGYRSPGDATFAIVADGGPTPFTEPDEVLLRIGLKAREIGERARQDASLTFVIDTSGSMERDGRLELVKDALRVLVDGLRDADTVSIVEFGDDGRVVLGPTPASRDREIIDAIDRLSPRGSTNLEAGLRLGYELVSVGVGMGNYNDVLLEQLADQGDGFYRYVNGPDEARRLFRDDLTGTLQTIALDARAQVEFEADVVAAYWLVGYENRAISDDEFSDPGVEAGAIGAGHAVTALYALRLREGVDGHDRIGTIRLRWTEPDRGGTDELARDILTSDLARSFATSDPYFRFDALVAASAEVLRASRWTGRLTLSGVATVADHESRGLPANDEVHAFLDLLAALARMEE